MLSSPRFGASALELPPVTVADRGAAVVVLLAGPFLALVAWRHGLQPWAFVSVTGAVVAFTIQVRSWTRSRLRPALQLEAAPAGTLRVRLAGGAPLPARLRPASRRIGPSVVLDVEYTVGPRRQRHRRWLTAWDVPADAVRRLTVVLPRSGRAACA